MREMREIAMVSVVGQPINTGVAGESLCYARALGGAFEMGWVILHCMKKG